MVEPATQSDEELLDRFQRAAFGYFLDQIKAENGLVADTSRAGSPASIAVVGFALSCYPVGVERGWMARADAAAHTLVTLRFFWNSVQSEQPDATGYKGFTTPAATDILAKLCSRAWSMRISSHC